MTSAQHDISPSTSPSRWTLPALALIVLLGAALRLYDVTHSLWLDELHTAWCVSGDFADIAPRARIGNYSPLYFWIVWTSTQVFGLTELGVRLPSLLAGIALIPAACFFTLKLTRTPSAGLLAALLVALEPTKLGWYSQEARPYALVMLLGLLHVWLFFELVNQGGWKRRLLFVAPTVTLFYLHYTAILLLTGEIVWYLWRRVRTGKDDDQRVAYPWHSLATDLAAGAVCCLPAWVHLSQIGARQHLWSAMVPTVSLTQWPVLFSPHAELTCMLVLVAIPLRWMALRNPGNWEQGRLKGEATLDPHPGLLFFLCWYLVPIVVAGLITQFGFAPVLYPRYLLVCFPALLIAAAWLLNLIPAARWQRLILALACFQFLALPPNPAHPGGKPLRFVSHYVSNSLVSHETEDWRGAVEHVRNGGPKHQHPVFLWAGLIEGRLLPQRADDVEFRRYLLFPISGMYSLDDGRPLEALGKEENRLFTRGDAELLKSAGSGWLVLRVASGPTHPSDPVTATIDAATRELAGHGLACRVAEKRAFRGVTVVRLAVGER